SPAHEVAAVITRPAAPAGRGRSPARSPVESLSRDAGIPVLTPRRPADPEFLERLTDLRIDCCPVVAYGALLPPTALAVPRLGWVNLHFSLLPAWRGAAPVQHAILRGDEITGASTFQIEAELDSGPVFGVVTEPIGAADTAGDLLARLSSSGAWLLLATLDGIASGTLSPRPQPTDGVSLAPKIHPAEAAVSWDSPALHVDRLIRACTPEPGAWTTFRGERLKLGPVRILDTHELAAGELRIAKSRVTVGTATCDLCLGDVQPPGKRPIPAPDWARGVRPQPGERIG
ncbi:MAG: methionyl-tRNA formyltransferase, partial [Actinomycetota bacterium]|nr:methionyl-tRNA formyltransferase [Actinomycetota bacterium]